MAFFEWKQDYSVGIHQLDQQHQKLVGMLNEIYEALNRGEGREALGSILDNLVSYTRTHFSTEERLMSAHGYPDYAVHKEKHDKMAEKVLDYRRKLAAGEIGSPIEISNFLKNWLARHILDTDRNYGPFLNARGVK